MSPQQEHLGPARSASVSGEGRGFAAADSKKVRPEALPVPTGNPLREIEGRGRRGIWGYGVSAGGSWRSLGILRLGSAPGCKGGAARPGKGLWGQRGAARGEPGGFGAGEGAVRGAGVAVGMRGLDGVCGVVLKGSSGSGDGAAGGAMGKGLAGAGGCWVLPHVFWGREKDERLP